MAKEEFDMKVEYANLNKKYKELPSFEELNEDFEIVTIEKNGILTRQLRRRMNDKVIFFCRIVENIIYPSVQSVIGAYEANFFSDEEKKELGKTHKKLMLFERESLKLDIEISEKGDIDFVVKLFKAMPSFKKELGKIIDKMIDSWKKEDNDEGEKYFG